MEKITDYDIQALVDNEVSWKKAEHILAFLQKNRKMRERYESLQRQKNLLQMWGLLEEASS